MNTSEILAFVQNGAVATPTLNRPDVRNAFNKAAIAGLTDTFRALADEPGVHTIILTGNDPAFCAGTDLNWVKKVTGYSDDENRADALRLAEMLCVIHTCPKSAIAHAQGDTCAGGVGLVVACDIVVAVDTANFCLSGAKLGLIPAITSLYVIYVLDKQTSRRYSITAEHFPAAEAYRLSLVHELVSTDALDTKVADITATLAANNPNAVCESKHLVREVSGAAINDVLPTDTAERIVAIHASEGGRGDAQSFLGRRKPDWLLPT